MTVIGALGDPRHSVALLGQTQGRDAAAETGARHDPVILAADIAHGVPGEENADCRNCRAAAPRSEK